MNTKNLMIAMMGVMSLSSIAQAERSVSECNNDLRTAATKCDYKMRQRQLRANDP